MNQIPTHPLWRVLYLDEHNRHELAKLLTDKGLLPLFEQVPILFGSLPEAVQARNQQHRRNPFVRTTADGPKRTWDFALRVFMAQSAGAQFLHAASHLFRGHSLEIFGHARTMIENAGIGYLARVEPDLTDAYLDSSRREEYRARTGKNKILPKADDLTSDLNEAFDVASRSFHSNFVSIAGRMESRFSEAPADKVSFVSEMKFHDIDPYDPRLFLAHACWLLGVTGLVLRLFVASFELESSAWSKQVEEYQALVGRVCGVLRPSLFETEDAPPHLGA